MEKVKKAWRPGFIDDRPKTREETLETLRSYLEHAKGKEEKAAKENANK